MKIIFMGTPEFSLHVLKKIIDDGHQIVSIYTKQDQLSGRGQRKYQNHVKDFGIQHNIPVMQPKNFKSEIDINELKSWEADLAVVAAYGILLPKEILETFKFGCLNLHPSLLPKYRGPSPVSTAILNNDSETGVSIMLLDQGMDSGPILSQEKSKIFSDETSGELTNRLFISGSVLMSKTIKEWVNGKISPIDQINEHASFTKLFSKKDGEINWKLPAETISSRIRALDPWPGSYTYSDQKLLKIISVSFENDSNLDIGQINFDQNISIGTKKGKIIVHKLQLEGKKRLNSKEFMRGNSFLNGKILGMR